MKIITVREHEFLSLKSSTVEDGLTDSQVDQLRRIETTLPNGALTWHHKKVKFAQFCGVVQLDGVTIEILPKIENDDDSSATCRDILIKMLYSAQRVIPKSNSAASIRLQKQNLLDVFINQFCDLLFEQIQQGLIRLYQEESQNLNVVRGKINLRQHLKYNLAHKEHLYCDYDELQIDNRYNWVIKATLNLLYSTAKNIRLRQRINELLFIFGDVSDFTININDIETLPKNRMVSRFETIFLMCEWFLSGFSQDVYAGNVKSLSLLFDMNRLFEAYITKELRKVARTFKLSLREQGPQRYLATEVLNNKNIFLMKPDITLLDAYGTPRLILDTKWKLLNSNDLKYGVSQADMYQMLTYAHQYNCQNVVLIYPRNTHYSNARQGFTTKVGDITIHVWTINLQALAGEGLTIYQQLHNHLQSVQD